MPYLVFSQTPEGRLDGAQLALHAERFFGARLSVLRTEGQGGGLAVQIALVPDGPARVFSLVPRPTTEDDLQRARDAELRGRAGGMALLAERCKFLWTIEAEPDEHPDEGEGTLMTLCAICASVALGPVLPPDGSTLFGVRGATERARLAASRS